MQETIDNLANSGFHRTESAGPFAGLFGAAPASGGGAGGTAGLIGTLIGAFLPHFATGGDFTVGGNGNSDNHLVAFNATPGEHVSVARRGQSGGDTHVTVGVTVDNQGALQAYVTNVASGAAARAARSAANTAKTSQKAWAFQQQRDGAVSR